VAELGSISRILASKEEAADTQLSLEEAAEIAKEHARLLQARVQRELEEPSPPLKAWLEEARALAQLQAEQPSAPPSRMPPPTLRPTPPSSGYRSVELTLPPRCTELRRLWPPDAFVVGEPDSVYRVPADPAQPGGTRFVASEQQAFPEEGVLSVGAAAGQLYYSGSYVQFRTEPDDGRYTSWAGATLWTNTFRGPAPLPYAPAEQRTVGSGIDALIDLSALAGGDWPTPDINVFGGADPDGYAEVQGQINLNIFSASSHATVTRTFVGARDSPSYGQVIFADERSFFGDSAINASIRLAQDERL
jgi:hypothetical protein